MEQTGKNIEKQLCIKQEIELLEAEEQEIIPKESNSHTK